MNEITFDGALHDRSGRRIHLARIGVRVGSVTALIWFLFGVESILRPEQVNARDVFWILPFTLTALTLSLVHSVQMRLDRRGLWERLSFQLLIFSMALVLAGNLGVTFDQPRLAALGFPGGAILWTLSMILFGIPTWRAGVLPWWVGLTIILLEPGSIATGLVLAPVAPLRDRGAYSAGIEKGLAIAILALGLQSWIRELSAPDNNNRSGLK